MSSETSAWAKEQRCGDPVTKAVLMEIANWAKPTGYCEFLSVQRIAEVTEVSPRTVQRHIARLETDVGDGGLGLIKRVNRYREDRGQGANSFDLVGYTPPDSPPPASRKGSAPPRQSVTPPCQIVTPGCQIDGEGGDTGVTRLGDKILIPPSPSDEGEAPAENSTGVEGGGVHLAPEVPASTSRATRLAADWTPPPVGDLPPMAQARVREWPAGAYEVVCETFRLHWLAETRAIGRKADWLATLGKWILNDHPKVMRDAKAGVSFAPFAPAAGSTGRTAYVQPAVMAKAAEDRRSAALHAALRVALGEFDYLRWFGAAALLFDIDGDVVLICGSDFQRGYIEQNFLRQVAAVLDAKAPEAKLRIEVEARRALPTARGSNTRMETEHG